MIPKNLVTIWVGPEMPDLVKECQKSHDLPGYKQIHITNDNYFHCRYVDECVSVGRFGKATDYLRMHYLYEHGGIYIDMDTKILKSFDDVLGDDLFVCEEANYFVANGIVGSIPRHPLLAEYLGKLERNFRGDGELVFQPGMGLWTEIIKQGPWVNSIKIYPAEWFLPYDWQSGVTKITDNTHTIHEYLQSWKKV